MMKRIFLCLAAAALLCRAVPAWASGEGREQVSLFDLACAADAAAGEPNPVLARISAKAARAAYKEESALALLEGLGFTDVVSRDLDSGAHTAGHYFGVKTVEAGGQAFSLFAVVIRGTNGTYAEWRSNFTPGDGDVHEGFSLAAEKIGADLEAYVGAHDEKAGAGAEGLRIWITGHSRGAACGNLLAARCVLAPPERVHAYLFAVPNTTKKPEPLANIRNFNYAGDLITRLPPAEYGYGRYGLDYLNDNGERVFGWSVATGEDADAVTGLILGSFPTPADAVRATDSVFDHLDETSEKLFSRDSLNRGSYLFLAALTAKLFAEALDPEKAEKEKPLTDALDGFTDAWISSDGRVRKLFVLHRPYMYDYGMADLRPWKRTE